MKENRICHGRCFYCHRNKRHLVCAAVNPEESIDEIYHSWCEICRQYVTYGTLSNRSCHGPFFFGKNQLNLAKGLKATQVHDSDTPSPFSQILGGGVGSKSLYVMTHVDIVDTSDARPCGLWSSVQQISITQMAKPKKPT
jgi:hypothetical protein